MHNVIAWLKARLELVVPILAVPTFFAMLRFMQGQVQPWQSALVYGLAAVYAGLVIWSPMSLPEKSRLPVDRAVMRRTLTVVATLVLVGALLLVVFSQINDEGGEGKTRLPYFVLALVLVIAVGSAGALAERGLTVDLLPVIRRREPKRVVYVLVSAFFLAMLTFFWSNLFSGVIESIGQAAGESAADAQAAASGFDTGSPIALLLNLLVGAGLYEELLFRLGIMTLVWRLTRGWGWGLLVSAVFFGLYHISPLSGMSTFNAANPVSSVLTSFTMGIIMGMIYRYRGFTSAVLVHGLGDWVVILLLQGSLM
ncbi:MAG: CPBP family intramembrane glutamic endopeptidase [Anaerolineales bacterium]